MMQRARMQALLSQNGQELSPWLLVAAAGAVVLLLLLVSPLLCIGTELPGLRVGTSWRKTAIRLALGASPMRTAVDPWLHGFALAGVAIPIAAGVALLTLKVLELSSAASLPTLEQGTQG